MVARHPDTQLSMSTSNSAVPRAGMLATGVNTALAVVPRAAGNLLRWASALGPRRRTGLPAVPVGVFAAVAVGIAVIVAAMAALDQPASEWARQLPEWITGPADEITNFGLSGRFLYPLGIILLIVAALVRPSLAAVTQDVLVAVATRTGFLFIAIAAPSLFDTIVKRLIGRARPYMGEHDNPFLYKPFIWLPEYSSMPSGHATTAAAAAIAFGAIWPRLRPVMWLYAVLIMLTRVVMNVHHPSDVIAGALVGIVGALMVRRWFASRGLLFFPDDLSAYPGPSVRRIARAVREAVALPARSAG